MSISPKMRSRLRRCRVCENRAMSDQELPPDEDVSRRVSPTGVVHLIDRSGYTFCGKDGERWHVWNPR